MKKSSPGAISPTRMTPLLNVENLARSLAFYEALGFELKDRVSEGEIGWCLLTIGDFRLMLNQSRHVDPTARKELRDYTDAVLYLYVDDAPAAYAELAAQEIPCRHVGPQDYGLDEVWIRDPDGYHVVVASDV